MNKIRVLSAADVRRALPMGEAIAGMKEAYRLLAEGRVDLPLRTRLAVPEQEGVALFMPAYVAGSGDLAIKVVGVFPRNAAQQKPMVYASVLVLDGQDGRPLALLEGSSLTAIRTGAGGGAGVDVLARPDAAVVAILGSGVQARTGLEAVCAVRQIREVRVFSPNRAHAEGLVAEMRGVAGVPDNMWVAEEANTAVAQADIIYTATSSHTPTFNAHALAPGSHITGVGSYTPTMQELDVETVRQAFVVVDQREAAWAEAGELIIARDQGIINPDHIQAELGEIINGSKKGRTSAAQITFFKSVGLAVQDAVAARLALQNAERLGLGTVVPF
jgi:ornithine cyclodeaminase/alanine dehydrogenase-like protein (mu-crystallin family)